MRTHSLVLVLGVLATVAAHGCAGAKDKTDGSTGGGARGGGLAGNSGTTVVYQPCVDGRCEDFPANPVVIGGVSPSAFGSPAASGGPCFLEPENNSLFPFNWLRPRFFWVPGPGQDRFKLVIHHPNQVNDYVVYTNEREWIMPKEAWDKLRIHIQDSPIMMTIYGADGSGSYTGSSSFFTIAPASASGDMLYWATMGSTYGDPNPETGTALVGLNVGSEGTKVILKPLDVQFQTNNNSTTPKQVQCVGCHTSVPGGGWVVFGDRWPWPLAIAGVGVVDKQSNIGQVPPYVTSAAVSMMNQPMLGISTTSGAHWSPGEYVVVTNKAAGSDDAAAKLIYINLGSDSGNEGAGWGVIARNGDPNGAASPAFYHNGTAIVYASTKAAKDGRLGSGSADLYTVPYNGGLGGPATPLGGASSSTLAEYYPALSIDDQLVAFTGLDSASAAKTCNIAAGEICGMYAAPNGEIYVVKSDGTSDTPTRLAANDPPACITGKSPGATNSWPKWSPDAVTGSNGTRYYWLVFSSKRAGYLDSASQVTAQLYITAVTIPKGEFTGFGTYGAIRLWNQPGNISNHTPAWDIFNLAAIP